MTEFDVDRLKELLETIKDNVEELKRYCNVYNLPFYMSPDSTNNLLQEIEYAIDLL